MVIIMKIISIAYDHEKRKSLPRFEEYLAYIFCPGTTVIGIWVSFPDFRKSLRKLKKNDESHFGKLCQTIGTFLNARWRFSTLILKKKIFKVCLHSFAGLITFWTILKHFSGMIEIHAFYFMSCYISNAFAIQSGYEIDIVSSKNLRTMNALTRSLNIQSHFWFKKCK